MEAHASDEIEVLVLELVEHLDRVHGVVLEIGVEQDDEFAAGLLHAVVHRGALAAVLA